MPAILQAYHVTILTPDARGECQETIIEASTARDAIRQAALDFPEATLVDCTPSDCPDQEPEALYSFDDRAMDDGALVYVDPEVLDRIGRDDPELTDAIDDDLAYLTNVLPW